MPRSPSQRAALGSRRVAPVPRVATRVVISLKPSRAVRSPSRDSQNVGQAGPYGPRRRRHGHGGRRPPDRFPPGQGARLPRTGASRRVILRAMSTAASTPTSPSNPLVQTLGPRQHSRATPAGRTPPCRSPPSRPSASRRRPRATGSGPLPAGPSESVAFLWTGAVRKSHAQPSVGGDAGNPDENGPGKPPAALIPSRTSRNPPRAGARSGPKRPFLDATTRCSTDAGPPSSGFAISHTKM